MHQNPQSFNSQSKRRRRRRRKCTNTESKSRSITLATATDTTTETKVICTLILLLIQLQVISCFNFMKETHMHMQIQRHRHLPHCNYSPNLAIKCHHIHHMIQNKNNLHVVLSSSSSTAMTLTKLNGIASRLYDMEAITESTTEFRISREDDDDENENENENEKYRSSFSSSFAPHDYNLNYNNNYLPDVRNGNGRGKGTTGNKRGRKPGARGGSGAGFYIPYESAIQALRTYHSQNGHLVMPRRYTIPPISIYPKQWHNLDIASTVYNMNWWSKNILSNPDRVKELNSLGFVWERLQPEWNLVLEAIIVYKSVYGHVKVPATFTVPYENSKEDKMGGGEEAENTDGISGDVGGGNNENDTASNSVWPKATWGIPLGNCVHRIRIRGDFLRDDELAWSRRRQLDGLGFIWDVQEHAFEKFFRALKIFAKLEQREYDRQSKKQLIRQSTGNSYVVTTRTKSGENRKRIQSQRRKALRVPQSFVVPSKKVLENGKMNPWPKDLWGYPLGTKCTAIRQKEIYIKNNPERQRALQDIGFQMSGNATIGWLNIVWASAIYSKIHGKGTLDVPVNFIIPPPPSSNDDIADNREYDSYPNEDEWPWPEQLWGFPLGQRLKDVRLKGAHLKNAKSAKERRAQLDALGFVWKPKRGRRKRSLGDGSYV